MKANSKIIPFPQPLRDARIVRVIDAEKLYQEELQNSYEEGRQAGERALSEQLVRQRAELIDLQNGVLASLRNTLPQVARECEQTVVALALEVARKLVAGLPISVEMVEAAIREACREADETAEFTVQLHPEDLAMLQKANSPSLLSQDGRERIRFEGCTHVSRGGCLVQTRFGVIDGRRETKFQNLQKALQP